MQGLPGERILLESDPKGLILTTHRVRSETRNRGRQEVISIMLEELVSCTITEDSSSSGLLVCAAISAALGILEPIGVLDFIVPRSPYARITGIVIALILLIVYFIMRQQIIVLASAAATIKSSTKGMSTQAAKDFIDIVEAAKNERYLQASKAVRNSYDNQP
jgi:hypothetical protein